MITKVKLKFLQNMVLLITFFIFLPLIIHAKWLVMVPDLTQQVVDARSDLKLTCIYQFKTEEENTSATITWILPDFLIYQEVCKYKKKKKILIKYVEFKIINTGTQYQHSFSLCG